MKKYILGFLTGIIASVGVVGVFAAAQEYTLSTYTLPVYIDGVKYPTDALPVLSLNLNGGDNTYVPLRNFSEMMGADVDYNKEAGRIDITTNANTTTQPNGNTNTGSNNAGTTVTTPVNLSSLDKTYNDTYRLNVYSVNGTGYVASEQIDDIYFEDEYSYNNDEYEFEDYDKRNATTIDLEYDDKVVVSSIPVLSTNDDDNYLIALDYFVNNIYPTIK